jgi:hypothetical protein
MPESRTDFPDRHPEHLRDSARALCGLVASDRAGRKAPRLCRALDLEEACLRLEKASSVVIITGFLVPEARKAETDGPPGSAVLGRALQRLGKECLIVTDSACLDVVQACSCALGGPGVIAVSGPEEALETGPDCLVYVERLGQAEDGCYYNMRGEDISSWTSPLDRAAAIARERGIGVIALGDGGNEAGMGSLGESLKPLVPGFQSCLCSVEADICLPVDVSNWGCYALSALLSSLSGRWLGHSPEEERAMLECMARQGAVDGATRKRGMTVDGFSEQENTALVESVRKAWEVAAGGTVA